MAEAEAEPAQGPAGDREPPRLFAFLSLLAVALLRGKVKGPEAGLAILVALTSKGTTGERAVVDEAQLTLESGRSARTIWRLFGALRDAGWFEQTEFPKRSARGQRARRARYRLTLPALDLALGTTVDHVPAPRVEVADEDDRRDEPSATFAVNRLPFPDRPSAIAAPEDGTVTPSAGTTSTGLPSASHPPASGTGGRACVIAGITVHEASLHSFEPIDAYPSRCAICARSADHVAHTLTAADFDKPAANQ